MNTRSAIGRATCRPARTGLTASSTYDYDHPAPLAQVTQVAGRSWKPDRALAGDLSSLAQTGVAAKGASGLSDDVIRLAEGNITKSGDTVLGSYPGYITIDLIPV